MTTATNTTATTHHPAATVVKNAGILTIIGALMGVVGALVLIMIPPSPGSEGTFAYPLDPAGHAVAQSVFALNHVLLACGLLAIVLSPRLRSPVARIGGWLALIGLAVLTATELAGIAFGRAPYPSDELAVIDTLYPISSMAIGVGLVVLGVGVARIRDLDGLMRWIVLATGLALFVIVTPGLMLGFVAGRVVLAIWMLFWAALGFAVAREGARHGG